MSIKNKSFLEYLEESISGGSRLKENQDHTPHHVAGIPEWAADQDEAEDAADAVDPDWRNRIGSGSGVGDDDNVDAEWEKYRAEHEAIANLYWARAYMALEKRHFSAMRNHAYTAIEAENWAIPTVVAIRGQIGRASCRERVAVTGGA